MYFVPFITSILLRFYRHTFSKGKIEGKKGFSKGKMFCRGGGGQRHVLGVMGIHKKVS